MFGIDDGYLIRRYFVDHSAELDDRNRYRKLRSYRQLESLSLCRAQGGLPDHSLFCDNVVRFHVSLSIVLHVAQET